MGLDLYIEARIIGKKTGRPISVDSQDEFREDEEKGFFEICWWCGWDACDVRDKMIEICNKYAQTNYTNEDLSIPIPQPALRKIYDYLMSQFDDVDNVKNAEQLHHWLYTMDSIKHDKNTSIENKYIPDFNDLMLLKENPEAYIWEFRIFNSY